MIKNKKAIYTIVSVFLCGVIITYIGLFKGKNIAQIASRAMNADHWLTSQELIIRWTYFPVIIGVSLIILSIILSYLNIGLTNRIKMYILVI